MTPAASVSSMSDRSRCSKVAYSCFRCLAYSTARCRDFSRSRENDGNEGLSVLFHGALQGMLMPARGFDHLGDLGLGDLIGKDPTHTDPILVHMQHNSNSCFPRLVEKTLQHVGHELH